MPLRFVLHRPLFDVLWRSKNSRKISLTFSGSRIASDRLPSGGMRLFGRSARAVRRLGVNPLARRQPLFIGLLDAFYALGLPRPLLRLGVCGRGKFDQGTLRNLRLPLRARLCICSKRVKALQGNGHHDVDLGSFVSKTPPDLLEGHAIFFRV